MKDVLPKKAQWLQDKVVSFKPNENIVMTGNGDTVQYEHMVVAMGLELYWDKVKVLIDIILFNNHQTLMKTLKFTSCLVW